MGRPERALDPTGGPITALAQRLRTLRKHAGLTLRNMAERSPTGYTAATFSRAQNGRLLTERVVLEYTEICGGNTVAVRKLLQAARRYKYQPETRPGRRRRGKHPVEVNDAHDLLVALHTLRLAAGQPSLRVMVQHAESYGRVIAVSTLGEVFAGKRFPSQALVETVALVLGVRDQNLADWRHAWNRAKAERDDLPTPLPKPSTNSAESNNGRRGGGLMTQTGGQGGGEGQMHGLADDAAYRARQSRIAERWVETGGSITLPKAQVRNLARGLEIVADATRILIPKEAGAARPRARLPGRPVSAAERAQERHMS